MRLTKRAIKGIIRIYLFVILQAIIFFVSAGHFEIPRAWILFGLGFVHLLALTITMAKLNPELINQRAIKRSCTKLWDKIFFAVYFPMAFILLAVAGLDVGRFQWSNIIIHYCIIGIVLYIVAAILTAWAMIVNPHFEPTVRIQKDRNHQVITSGPYKKVRHPGYAGGILSVISTPLIVGSTFAFIPAGIMIFLLIIRTALEDKMLNNELKGYTEYTKRVRCRLFPGVW